MLIGSYAGQLSVKRRVAIPKAFRSELGDIFIVARWYEGCLVLVAMDNWNNLLTKLVGKAEAITQPVRDTDRFILGSAYTLEPDDQGRVVLPENLTEYAMLTKHIKFVGLGDRVEVWEETKWDKRQTYIQKEADKFVEEIAKDSTKK